MRENSTINQEIKRFFPASQMTLNSAKNWAQAELLLGWWLGNTINFIKQNMASGIELNWIRKGYKN